MSKTQEFFKTIKTGDVDAIADMLKADPELIRSPDPQGRSPLEYAIEKNCTDAAIYLIEHGVNVNVEDVHGITPFIEAIRHGAIEIVKSMVHHGADVNKDGEPLAAAELFGQDEIKQLLVEHGAVHKKTKFDDSFDEYAKEKNKSFLRAAKQGNWKYIEGGKWEADIDTLRKAIIYLKANQDTIPNSLEIIQHLEKLEANYDE